MTDYENLLKRVEELEEKSKENDRIIEKLVETNHQLAQRVTELINILVKNGISLSSKKDDFLTNKELSDINSEVEQIEQQVENLDNQDSDNYYRYPNYSQDEKEDHKNIAISVNEDNNFDIDYQNQPTNSVDMSDETIDISDSNVHKKLLNVDAIENSANDDVALDSTDNKYLGDYVKLDQDVKEPEEEFNDVQKINNEEEIDYGKSKGKKIFKIKNIRKSFNWNNIKQQVKSNWKKVVATLLVAAVSLPVAVLSMMSSSKDKNTSNVIQKVYYDIPGKSAINELFKSNDDNANKDNGNQEQEINHENNEQNNENNENILIKVSAPKVEVDKNNKDAEYNADINMENYSIGQNVEFSGNYIYKTSQDANAETNKLNSYYTKNDQRSIAAIQMVSPDGSQHIIITEENKNQQKTLENMGWSVESYNVNNDTRNVDYEGWINTRDLEVSNENYR